VAFFAPALDVIAMKPYEDAEDIERNQGLSLRFMKGEATEVGAFQAGAANSEIRIVDNYPVEIIFSDQKQSFQTDNITDESDAPLLVTKRFHSLQTPVTYS